MYEAQTGRAGGGGAGGCGAQSGTIWNTGRLVLGL